ncbi:MAG: CehA/McbA family metallohydrolase [Halobacteriota archaeon]
MLTAELHTHTALSHDGRDEVELLLEQAEGVGLDAMAVTDHDAIEASLRAEALAPEYGLLGIPGIEVTSAAGHVIGLGVREVVDPFQSFEATARAIHDAGGIVIVPHPFQSSRHGVLTAIEPEPVIEHADAIEVYNSRLLTGRSNRQADRFAVRHGLSRVAGSDAHICEMVGQAVTHVDAEDRTVEALTDAIAAGRTEIEGKRTPWHISLRQAGGGAKRRLRRRLPW